MLWICLNDAHCNINIIYVFSSSLVCFLIIMCILQSILTSGINLKYHARHVKKPWNPSLITSLVVSELAILGVFKMSVSII